MRRPCQSSRPVGTMFQPMLRAWIQYSRRTPPGAGSGRGGGSCCAFRAFTGGRPARAAPRERRVTTFTVSSPRAGMKAAMNAPSTLEEVIPRLRGLLHAYAFWFAAVAAVVLVALAPNGQARIAATIYGAGLCALFAASGLYHRWRWHPRWKPLLRRVDHSTIYVFIAATTTPVAALGLDGPMRTVLLIVVWVG